MFHRLALTHYIILMSIIDMLIADSYSGIFHNTLEHYYKSELNWKHVILPMAFLYLMPKTLLSQSQSCHRQVY